MAQNPHYTPYHPKWYRTRMPIFWWVNKWAHIRFILRELTSLFVAFYVLVLLFEIRALAQGPEAYAGFLAWLKSPASLVLHFITLLFVLFHSVTWFSLAPKALVIRVGKKPVPGVAIMAANFIAWGVVSLVIAWIMLKA